ncbi:MAG: acyl carrier protein [Muribaculaceae bacterium]|nr:acyl carrier protein [Muribaculaceae bacterium]
MADIAEQVKSIIVDKLGVDAAEVTPDATFQQDLGADSLDIVELMMQLENEFGVKIPEDEANKIQTVGEAIKFIEDAPQA